MSANIKDLRSGFIAGLTHAVHLLRDCDGMGDLLRRLNVARDSIGKGYGSGEAFKKRVWRLEDDYYAHSEDRRNSPDTP